MSSHHQLLYHLVFSIKERRPLLQHDEFRESVSAYMAGVCKNLMPTRSKWVATMTTRICWLASLTKLPSLILSDPSKRTRTNISMNHVMPY